MCMYISFIYIYYLYIYIINNDDKEKPKYFLERGPLFQALPIGLYSPL